MHNLDALDETQRRALLAGGADTIRVAYTVRRPLCIAAAAIDSSYDEGRIDLRYRGAARSAAATPSAGGP